ncbi:hypothetical protein ACWKWU_14730 [Chitinophaga lutea]
MMPALAFSQGREVDSIRASFDPDAVAELYGTTPIGLEIWYKDGTKRSTAGLLKGDLRWSDVKVQTAYGEVNNGVLRYDRNSARPDNYRLRLLVTLGERPSKQYEVMLQLPYLTGIRFRHYADSLKRGIQFYLNVEGIYNTGRIYPLDTTRIRFTASTGELIGQNLLIPLNDSLTRSIDVTAVYRGDSTMRVESVVPVKQLPDDESLLKTESEIFGRPAKKKRNRSN